MSSTNSSSSANHAASDDDADHPEDGLYEPVFLNDRVDDFRCGVWSVSRVKHIEDESPDFSAAMATLQLGLFRR